MSGEKSKYWVGVLYPENMIEDWEDVIAEKVQLPFAYCVHNRDVDSEKEKRKEHVHLMIVFRNTTTYNHAMSVYQTLSAEGKSCTNKIERVFSVRGKYNYLIHDTDECRKKKKVLYDKSERIEGNGFDIGLYEQVSVDEQEEMIDNMSDDIMECGLTNFYEAFAYVKSNYDKEYVRLFRKHSGFFERLTRGLYHHYEMLARKSYEDAQEGD